MRHNQNRRSRGRPNNPGSNGGGGGGGGGGGNRKGPNPLTRSYESNGPDVKVRGTAAHVAEKYMTLARDALSSGDNVAAENYLQHAEHYNRIIFAAQALQQQSQPVQTREYGDDEDGEEEDRFFAPRGGRDRSEQNGEQRSAPADEGEEGEGGYQQQPREFRERSREPREGDFGRQQRPRNMNGDNDREQRAPREANGERREQSGERRERYQDGENGRERNREYNGERGERRERPRDFNGEGNREQRYEQRPRDFNGEGRRERSRNQDQDGGYERPRGEVAEAAAPAGFEDETNRNVAPVAARSGEIDGAYEAPVNGTSNGAPIESAADVAEEIRPRRRRRVRADETGEAGADAPVAAPVTAASPAAPSPAPASPVVESEAPKAAPEAAADAEAPRPRRRRVPRAAAPEAGAAPAEGEATRDGEAALAAFPE
ncbi:protein of unknown function [Faunimonas pinastri]|uniref:DUF4167 domain-containing protein n=1 Tax=Faunimonas pinastri TaxID=1855383 RepID=A0A1H9LSP5_9HYPH|nr:DUF4167 domain-containing protein [Faunimonas pinastri]SER14338.1 protein of unknown function [Faunimonas pinastri]